MTAKRKAVADLSTNANTARERKRRDARDASRVEYENRKKADQTAVSRARAAIALLPNFRSSGTDKRQELLRVAVEQVTNERINRGVHHSLHPLAAVPATTRTAQDPKLFLNKLYPDADNDSDWEDLHEDMETSVDQDFEILNSMPLPPTFNSTDFRFWAEYKRTVAKYDFYNRIELGEWRRFTKRWQRARKAVLYKSRAINRARTLDGRLSLGKLWLLVDTVEILRSSAELQRLIRADWQSFGLNAEDQDCAELEWIVRNAPALDDWLSSPAFYSKGHLDLHLVWPKLPFAIRYFLNQSATFSTAPFAHQIFKDRHERGILIGFLAWAGRYQYEFPFPACLWDAPDNDERWGLSKISDSKTAAMMYDGFKLVFKPPGNCEAPPDAYRIDCPIDRDAMIGDGYLLSLRPNGERGNAIWKRRM
ncbi:hypothetical protein P152DRAFT_463103 [Eremomyces bilateralis CBS 781.70]|uniref:Uncharacterized protein n=1 Tax=Eremomyces bilateralis CBS 781.70 TaxID=1392243 RepID=A0A6G1FQB5_9PEZI|nr:uncharacterized protein P152DRAFT_463136 [Eremomyces bilateralis CBS 781.70]XP_033529510.1 uncharacterized protein P152DRAFT_463103 [Eremomyces bilateralis CBS 781.70]KAF1807853.1 hypothetical protein P152DRAFT_463136 [Eremomyces bilateralis CBS 781.70]KAF1807879.1 hypothetical protein P152DRAFT_463103 [Eremomyces bilateralis CBS 781.70]